MAIQTTDGVVLKKHDLRESSLVLTFFTRDFGKISGVIKGVRGPRAQLGATPQLFSLDRIVFYESKRRNLSVISQCDLKDFFDPIRKDLEKSVYAKYFLELVDSLSAEYDKSEEVFRLLVDSLQFLCTPASTKRAARIFEIRLLNLVGLMPELVACVNCENKTTGAVKFSFCLGGILCENCFNKDKTALNISRGTINFIEHVKDSLYQKASRIKVSMRVGMELEAILRKFVDYHLQGKLKTMEFLTKVGL